MTTPPDEQILELLSRGDVAAAEKLVAAYAPYLRAVARGHLSERLRGKFDSADVVQSVWVQVVRKLRDGGWRADTEAELRALLATIARRRAINRARYHGPKVNREEPAEAAFDALPADDQPRPSEFAQADDLWEQMLKLCPPEHHEILRLRRDGLTSSEIAAKTGLHDGSVRRILRRLARDLALAGHPIFPTDAPDADSSE